MGSSFKRISDFFVVLVVVLVVQEVLHERGFSELRASRAKKILILLTEGDITGPGDGIPPEDIPGDIGFPGPTPAPT